MRVARRHRYTFSIYFSITQIYSRICLFRIFSCVSVSQQAHLSLASGASLPDLHRGSVPGPRWGDFRPSDGLFDPHSKFMTTPLFGRRIIWVRVPL